MNLVLIIVLGLLMLTAALTALYLKNLTSAVIASGAVSLLASVLFLLLAAPDVAMTEAAIGSALTTVVFLYALSRMRGRKKEEPRD
jgi:uncharacterized MnhB-related membrane protein